MSPGKRRHSADGGGGECHFGKYDFVCTVDGERFDYTLPEGSRVISVGRDTGANVATPSAKTCVSGYHLLFGCDAGNGCWVVRDQSSNGTWIGAERVKAATKAPLDIPIWLGVASGPEAVEFLILHLPTPRTVRTTSRGPDLNELRIVKIATRKGFVYEVRCRSGKATWVSGPPRSEGGELLWALVNAGRAAERKLTWEAGVELAGSKENLHYMHSKLRAWWRDQRDKQGLPAWTRDDCLEVARNRETRLALVIDEATAEFLAGVGRPVMP